MTNVTTPFIQYCELPDLDQIWPDFVNLFKPNLVKIQVNAAQIWLNPGKLTNNPANFSEIQLLVGEHPVKFFHFDVWIRIQDSIRLPISDLDFGFRFQLPDSIPHSISDLDSDFGFGFRIRPRIADSHFSVDFRCRIQISDSEIPDSILNFD